MEKRKFLQIRNGVIYFLVFIGPLLLMPIFGINRIGASIGPIVAVIFYLASKLVESILVKRGFVK